MSNRSVKAAFSARLDARLLDRLREISIRTRIPQVQIVVSALNEKLAALELQLAAKLIPDFGPRNEEET